MNDFLKINKVNILSYLSLLGIFMVLFQITLGGVVRVTESGLGCPDWPLCDGEIIPDLDYHTAIEWGHRVSGSSIGIIILVINFFSLKFFGSKSRESILGLFLLLLVLIEGVLGGITVLTELVWWIRLIHLGVSFVILFEFAYLYAISKPGLSKNSFSKKLKPFHEKMLFFLLPSVLILMLYGATSVGRGANSSCMSWPDCMGQWITFKEKSYFIHMIHRYLAVIIGLLILYSAHIVGRFSSKNTFVKLISRSLSFMFVFQIIFSILLVTAGFTNLLRVIHLTFAATIWIFSSWLFIEYRLYTQSTLIK